jgi:integrase
LNTNQSPLTKITIGPKRLIMASLGFSKWYKWGFYKQGDGTFIIRRYRLINGKKQWESYPRDKYRDFNTDEIQALLRRLNTSLEIAQQEALARYDFDHAFINSSTLNKFENYLKTKANSRGHIKTLMANLKDYTLKYYIHTLKLPDPNFWKKNESGFGHYLLNTKISSGYIKRIIQTTNRFIRFLHEMYPEEVRLYELDPISNNVLKNKALESPNKTRKKFISDKDFEIICRDVDRKLLPAIKLAYFFGLRRAEVLGLNPDDVYEEFLNVERQLVKLNPTPYHDPVKSQEKRDVPFWFCSNEEAYNLINNIIVMHPDTLSREFDKEMKRLEYSYQFHDLRRTFITRALRKYHYLDVKLAAGHSDLETTNKYIQDDREMQRKKFKPGIKRDIG